MKNENRAMKRSIMQKMQIITRVLLFTGFGLLSGCTLDPTTDLLPEMNALLVLMSPDCSNYNADVQYFVAGSSGQMAMGLNDGDSWITLDLNTVISINASTAARIGCGGQQVLVADAGTVFYTDEKGKLDGKTTATNQNLYGVAHGSGTYVAVGNAGTALTSSDGINWTLQDTGGTTNHFTGVAYNPTAYGFVAVTAGNIIQTTSDGVNWITPVTTLPTGLMISAIGAGRSKFIIAGLENSYETIYISDNGKDWAKAGLSDITTTESINGITVNPHTGRLVAVGNSGRIWYSDDDGLNWYGSTSTGGTENYHAITYGWGNYVAVGMTGLIMRSTDGVNFSAPTNAATGGADWNTVIPH